jgi:hypothetical protein
MTPAEGGDAAYASALSEPRIDQLTSAQRQSLADELAELEGPARAAVVQAIKTATRSSPT